MLAVQSKIQSRAFLSFMVIVSLAIFTGCGVAGVKKETRKSSAGSMRLAQSHYTFPNSNVTPIGTASARASRAGNMYQFPDVQAANQEALDKAIESKGGDLMLNATIDGTLSTTTYMTGSDLNIDYLYEVLVQGTVATMEIGKQNLR